MQSCKTLTVTSAITHPNGTRSPDIIILPRDTKKTPIPNKPVCCLETEASTVKKNNLFHYLSSQYGMDQAQQTTAQLYGPVPHRACVNTRHLARGSREAHTALCVHACVSMYRLPPVPEGRAVAQDPISSMWTVICKRLTCQRVSCPR